MVLQVSAVPGPVVVPSDSYINGKPIVYFRTYAGAAYKACQHGLLTPLEACAVIQDCCLALRAEGEANPSDPAFPSECLLKCYIWGFETRCLVVLLSKIRLTLSVWQRQCEVYPFG